MAQFMVEKKMTFIEHNQEFYVATPIMYMIARAYSATSNGVNPALGFSFELAYAVNTGDWDVMEMAYILVFGPYAGALVAVFLFEFAMKPMFPLKRE
jgi:glycerol uptake facilitator-like aquaporin